MRALKGGAWGEALAAFGASQRPEAVLVVSAHWESGLPPRLSAAASPGVMHDFGGFPDELYQLDYPAPGSPELALRAADLMEAAGLEAALEPERPLDHGAWVPLMHLYPDAELPVVQLSLTRPRRPQELFALGAALAPLRREGVLIAGSGGLVHNLRRLAWRGEGAIEPWAAAFEDWASARVLEGDAEALLDWERLAPEPRLAHPGTEHFDPLFAALGAAGGSRARDLYVGWELGSLSLRCFVWD